MSTQMNNETSEGMVKTMREIRDDISNEIKHMTFEEESAYLDQLLTSGNRASQAHDKNREKMPASK